MPTPARPLCRARRVRTRGRRGASMLRSASFTRCGRGNRRWSTTSTDTDRCQSEHGEGVVEAQSVPIHDCVSPEPAFTQPKTAKATPLNPHSPQSYQLTESPHSTASRRCWHQANIRQPAVPQCRASATLRACRSKTSSTSLVRTQYRPRLFTLVRGRIGLNRNHLVQATYRIEPAAPPSWHSHIRRSRFAYAPLAGTSMTTKESPCPNHPLSSCWHLVGSTDPATQSASSYISRPDHARRDPAALAGSGERVRRQPASPRQPSPPRWCASWLRRRQDSRRSGRSVTDQRDPAARA